GIEAIASARAGVFQITEPFSTDVAAYGIYDTSSRKKEIRVTVHAVFVIH
ncbi:MAG: SIMPL domain-containing protein, partial [marine benthic group bacterium]|nr:SIMPL domain-containing protein [Gemmatimonadota bacterium]